MQFGGGGRFNSLGGTGDSKSQKEEKAPAEAGWLKIIFQEGLPQKDCLGAKDGKMLGLSGELAGGAETSLSLTGW